MSNELDPFDAEEQEEQEKEADLIQEAFDSAVTNESDEDEIKLQMISAGATFKNVTRLYNQYMIDAGLAISKADRNEIVESTLEGLDFDTEEAFSNAVVRLVDAVKGSNDRSASALVRAYAKKNELEVYVKPKGEASPRAGLTSDLYDFIVENPMQTDEQLTEYVNRTADEKGSANFANHLSSHLGVLKLARRVAEKYGQSQAA